MSQNGNGSNNDERAQAVREGGDGDNLPREIFDFAQTGERESTNGEVGLFEDEEDASAFANISPWTYTEFILPLKHKTSPVFLCSFGHCLTERGQERLGFFLARATHLARVLFDDYDRSVTASRLSLSRVLRGPFEDHNLELFYINACPDLFARDGNGEPMGLNDDDLTCIGNYVEKARSLKTFELRTFEVGTAGIEILSNVLNRARPKHLVFRWMRPERGALCALLRRQFTRSLESLELISCPLERDAFKALAEILSDINARLRKLNLLEVAVGDTGAKMLCHALEGNKTLKTLGLNFRKLSDESHKYFEKLLCNDSSLDGIYESNHTINFEIGGLHWSLGQMNEAVSDGRSSSNDIALNRRKKIVKYLRLGNSFNATPFHTLDLEILPYALQFVGQQCPVELTNRRDAFFKVDDMYRIILSANVDTLFGK